jgi:hypothetical protein
LNNVKENFSGFHSIHIFGKKYNIHDNTNAIDYGIVGGIDYSFSISTYNVFMDLRYGLSLNALYKPSDWEWAHHKALSFSLGIKF